MCEMAQLLFLHLNLGKVKEDTDVMGHLALLVLHRNDGELLGVDGAFLAPVPNFALPLACFSNALPHGGVEGGVLAAGREDFRGLADHLLSSIAGDARKGRVDRDDAARCIGDHRGVERMLIDARRQAQVFSMRRSSVWSRNTSTAPRMRPSAWRIGAAESAIGRSIPSRAISSV